MVYFSQSQLLLVKTIKNELQVERLNRFKPLRRPMNSSNIANPRNSTGITPNVWVSLRYFSEYFLYIIFSIFCPLNPSLQCSNIIVICEEFQGVLIGAPWCKMRELHGWLYGGSLYKFYTKIKSIFNFIKSVFIVNQYS